MTTESLEEHWGPLSSGLLNSPEALGIQSTEIIASPVSSALEYCWSTQLLSNGHSVSGLQDFDGLATAGWNLSNLQTANDESTVDHPVRAFTASEPYLGSRYIGETEISRLFEDVALITLALNDAYIDHEPMSSGIEARKPLMQTFGVHYRLAQCCARIASDFDSQEALSQSMVFTSENLDNWLEQLQQLKVDVFTTRHQPASAMTWDPRIASPNSPCMTPSEGDISASLLYFELVLCVCGRFSASSLGDSSTDKIEQRVLESAIDILKLLVEVDPTKAGTDQNLVRIAVSSFCLVATFISRANERATIFRYLVSTLGFFARMTINSPLMTLGKFSSVVDSVQKVLKNDG
ncbi:uncharacterized protein CCOS01_10445 [Colletotrichum costaricense]|uniref:Uncharacterized protein n=1 Tax=Colletotrichum costaricense TaxID=1209916 RepID=A0AAJ0DY64_9PEZI|nr:uncharacterized protein CCOS01_10445 [Colletotrichum costaricense]KAK1520326.1 hypothetical protein CCOS01_10445 [Colletotrichum costaricense]